MRKKQEFKFSNFRKSSVSQAILVGLPKFFFCCTAFSFRSFPVVYKSGNKNQNCVKNRILIFQILENRLCLRKYWSDFQTLFPLKAVIIANNFYFMQKNAIRTGSISKIITSWCARSALYISLWSFKSPS